MHLQKCLFLLQPDVPGPFYILDMSQMYFELHVFVHFSLKKKTTWLPAFGVTLRNNGTACVLRILVCFHVFAETPKCQQGCVRKNRSNKCSSHLPTTAHPKAGRWVGTTWYMSMHQQWNADPGNITLAGR